MAYKDTKKYNQSLQQQIADLQNKITDYEYKLSRGSSSTKILNEELQNAKFLAGESAVEGPGIIVTLSDSKKKPSADANPFALQESIIHDTDILRAVNELRAAGAEFISVNDQRLIANSPIRCIGPVVQVNSVPMASPYVIRAIGEPKTLDGALRVTGGTVDNYTDPAMIDIKQEQMISVPSYTGTLQFKYGKSVTGQP
jgi:uncharacterized protein YlxW (UPF0749 family)